VPLGGDNVSHPVGDQTAYLVADDQVAFFPTRPSNCPIADSDDWPAAPTIQKPGSTLVLSSAPFAPTSTSEAAELDDNSVASCCTPYINLRPVACTAELLAYQQQHDLNVNVYTAHASTPASASHSPVSVVDATSLLGDNILSYVAATTLPSPKPISSTEGDNKSDTLTQGRMLRVPDRDKFVHCQQDEMTSLTDLDIMDILPIKSLPPKVKLLNSIWSYSQKRLPNGVLLKYKARLCVNGKEQAFGRNYWETYAPVTAWSTIRLLLYLSTVLSLHTRQVDYTSAFPQADLDVPVYMKVLQGWFIDSKGHLQQHEDPKYQDTTHYLGLKKNLYGCKQAARNWFRHLADELKKQGFRQSSTDSCLFLRENCIIVVYVDDCLFFSPSSQVIDGVITSLSRSLKLKDEGDVAAFLGVNIKKNPNSKTIELTQPGLVDQILRDVGLIQHSKSKDTPVDSILHPDESGPARVEQWNYCSLIG
jgi:hypothetical protein